MLKLAGGVVGAVVWLDGGGPEQCVMCCTSVHAGWLPYLVEKNKGTLAERKEPIASVA